MSVHDNIFLDSCKGNEIAAELAHIETALREPQTDERYYQLYAAQQALAWALNPGTVASPYLTIQRGLVRPLIHTQEDSGDCLAESRHCASSGTSALRE